LHSDLDSTELIPAEMLLEVQSMEDFHLGTKVAQIRLKNNSATMPVFFLPYFKTQGRVYSNKGRMMQDEKMVIKKSLELE